MEYYYLKFSDGKECGVTGVAGLDCGDGRIRFYPENWTEQNVPSFKESEIEKCYWRPEENMDGRLLHLVEVDSLFEFWKEV